MDDSTGGLRERKKQRTRDDLTAAAARLFEARGFDDVTIEEIADAAEVSPRTFYRYFASKEDLIFGDLDTILGDIRHAFSERPADEPVLASLQALLRYRAASIDADPASMLWQGRVIRATPALVLRRLERQNAIEAALVPIVAERLGANAGDLRPLLVVTVAFAAFRSAVITWICGETDRPLVEFVDEALDTLSGGFGAPIEPSPATTSRPTTKRRPTRTT